MDESDLDKWLGLSSDRPHSVYPVGDEQTYAVTLVKVGAGLPIVEVGAYRYTADRLPTVGERIPITPVSALGEIHGYVTRINPASDSPISVVEVPRDENSTDDLVA